MRKLTYEYVKQYFNDHRCELLEKGYKNANTKMKYKCGCKNVSEITFGNFQQGQRCIKCSGSEKYTYQHVFKYFIQQGCELLEKEYKNVHHSMEYKCNCGNAGKISFTHFRTGHRCRKCGNKRIQEGVESRI